MTLTVGGTFNTKTQDALMGFVWRLHTRDVFVRERHTVQVIGQSELI